MLTATGIRRMEKEFFQQCADEYNLKWDAFFEPILNKCLELAREHMITYAKRDESFHTYLTTTFPDVQSGSETEHTIWLAYTSGWADHKQAMYEFRLGIKKDNPDV